MNFDCVKSEIHYSDEEVETKYDFNGYLSTNNLETATENPLEYPIESFKVECPDSIKLEPDPLSLDIENEEFPEPDMLIDFHSKQRICLSIEGQSICLNVYHNLRKMENLMHTEAVVKTSHLCGISRTSMFNLVRRGAKERRQRCDAGSCKLSSLFTEDLETVKKRVRDYFICEAKPTIVGLLSTLVESNPQLRISERSLGRRLRDIGFKTQRIKNRNILLENGKPVK